MTIITPITTLVQGKISEGKSRSEAESEVATLLGISTSSLYTDYEASNDTTLQNIAYNIASTMQNNGNSISSTISALGGGGTSSSGGSSSGGGGSSSDGVTISSTSPASGATGVDVYRWIEITFSKDMNSSTLTPSTMTLSGDKACQTVDYDTSSKKAKCLVYNGQRNHRLDNNTTYTLTLSTAIKDTAGNALSSPYTLSFTTTSDNNLSSQKTGQTTVAQNYDDGWYATTGNLGISRSFSRASSIVSDSSTSLQWQDDTTPSAATLSDANNTCNSLILGGYGEWRLPTLAELATISDKSDTASPIVFSTFQNTSSGTYYTADTTSSGVWTIDFATGKATHSTSGNHYVRCVRGSE